MKKVIFGKGKVVSVFNSSVKTCGIVEVWFYAEEYFWTVDRGDRSAYPRPLHRQGKRPGYSLARRLRGQQCRRQIRLRRQGGCGFSCGEMSAERNYSLIGELRENLLTSIDRAKHRKAEPFHVTVGNGKFLPNHVNCKCGMCL